MLVRRRVLAFGMVVAAAAALCWASSRGPAPTGFTSGSPSASAQKASSSADLAVVETRTPSLVRALTGDKLPQRDLPWELLIPFGLAGIAAVAIWTRFFDNGRSSSVPLRVLRGDVALRAPPPTELV